MLDDFDNTSSFLDDLEAEDGLFDFDDEPTSKGGSEQGRKKGFMGFLGMSPVQTFVISVLMFFEVCFIGYFFLLVANKMALP